MHCWCRGVDAVVVVVVVVCVSQSRTETSCDYVAFFRDGSHAERWGEERYSGRDGRENWPGCGGRPPLEVFYGAIYCIYKTTRLEIRLLPFFYCYSCRIRYSVLFFYFRNWFLFCAGCWIH